jgi:hypothetical protein
MEHALGIWRSPTTAPEVLLPAAFLLPWDRFSVAYVPAPTPGSLLLPSLPFPNPLKSCATLTQGGECYWITLTWGSQHSSLTLWGPGVDMVEIRHLPHCVLEQDKW